MALNFSEWKDSHKDPEYQIEGKEPKCTEGHKWDSKLKTCVPDNKNGENPGQKECPSPMLGYDIFGSTGVNGDGVAIAVKEETILEKPIYTQRSEKDSRQDLESVKKHKEQDDRMRYGKSGKPTDSESLRPGEVKRWDKVEKRWVSNKESK